MTEPYPSEQPDPDEYYRRTALFHSARMMYYLRKGDVGIAEYHRSEWKKYRALIKQ